MRVEAMGMSSSLGPVATAAAAFRAGIVRPKPSADVATFAPGDSEPQPVTVYELPGSTFGFSGVGRLVSIAMDALEDLATYVPLQTIGQEAGVFLALPDFSNGMGPQEAAAAAERLGRQVLGRALDGLGVCWPEDRWCFFTGGSAGFALALEAARREMERRSLETCIVGGLDSLVDPEHLRYLLGDRRLKTADNPVGLLPGEAGALLVLRSRRSVRKSEATPAIEFTSVHIAHEPNSLGTGRRPDGRVLSSCVQAVLRASFAGDSKVLLVSDLNGEERRAWEWGNALVHLKASGALHGEEPVWVPATGFGDVGAAGGAVGACLSVRAFLRGYALARRIVVVSQADSGERAAFSLVVGDIPGRGGRT
ncbi:MAG TPA: hypothetical protein VFZ09_00635 [Archangium sp.]|uniref:hypothetical protein n=1 Tax=Archangium sp. TaxID=1872627 RepID=UPI002E308104|nr:hypothetical protein [Archangium sp.]HEX5744712.1 hypothetical protein [Archangium sp.]